MAIIQEEGAFLIGTKDLPSSNSECVDNNHSGGENDTSVVSHDLDILNYKFTVPQIQDFIRCLNSNERSNDKYVQALIRLGVRAKGSIPFWSQLKWHQKQVVLRWMSDIDSRRKGHSSKEPNTNSTHEKLSSSSNHGAKNQVQKKRKKIKTNKIRGSNKLKDNTYPSSETYTKVSYSSTPQVQLPKVSVMTNEEFNSHLSSLSYTEEESDDSSETQAITLDLTLHTFYYYEVNWLYSLFGFRVTKKSVIHKCIRDLIHEFFPCVLSEYSAANLDFKIKNSPVYLEYLKQMHLDAYGFCMLWVNIRRYYHALAVDISQEEEPCLKTVQTYNVSRKRISDAFNNKKDFPLSWRRILFLGAAGLAAYCLVKTSPKILWSVTKTVFKLGGNILLDSFKEMKKDLSFRSRKACILRFAPITSVYLEEFLRPAFHHHIQYLDWILSRDTEVHKFHDAMYVSNLNFMRRVQAHLQFNSRSVDIVHTYNSMVAHGTTPGLSIDTKQMQLCAPTQFLHKRHVPYVQGETFAYPNPKVQEFVFPLLFGVTCMASPTNSAANFNAALLFRIIKASFPQSGAGVWLNRALVLPKFTFNFQNDIPKWKKKLYPRQLRKIQYIEEQVLLGSGIDKRTTVFCKTDEMIPYHEKFLPRVIFNVSPYYLYKLGCFIYELQKHISAEIFNGKTPHEFPYHSGKHTVYVYFSCGATSETLSEVWNYWRQNDLKGIMIMGDDCVFTDNSLSLAWETDYSKFDASQKAGQALEVLPQYLEILGFPEQAADYREMYHQPIKSSQRKDPVHGRVHGHVPVLSHDWDNGSLSMRLTGEPATCLANSLVNICAATFCWDKHKLFHNFGLKVKHRKGKYVTFLKGVFLPISPEGNHFQWVRLPCFILKFGKTLTHPVTMTKCKNYDKALRQALWSQWLGYGDLINQNWFYRRLHEILYCLTGAPVGKATFSEYSVKSEKSVCVDKRVFNEFMLTRYGISEAMMLDYLEFLSNITRVGVVYTHPLLQLLLIDYI